MPWGDRGAASWTPDRAAYAYTSQLSALGWAWEFLRRNPRFRDEARAHRRRDRATRWPRIVPCRQDDGTLWMMARRPSEAAERWGLQCFPNPDHDGVRAAPFWTPELLGGEIATIVDPPKGYPSDLLPLSQIPGRKTVLIRPRECVRMLVTGPGYGEMLVSAALARPPTGDPGVALAVGGLQGSAAGVDRLAAFVDYCRNPGRRTRQVRDTSVIRLTNALIAFDGKRAGRSYREIAHAFYDPDQIADDWRGPGAIKQQMRRFAVHGESLTKGGYRRLLSLRQGVRRDGLEGGNEFGFAENDTPALSTV